MRVLIATDAWRTQVNGVVRTLTWLARSALDLGVTIDFLTPEGFPSIPVPTYPGLRLALPSPTRIARRIEQASPDAIHIANEGPIGLLEDSVLAAHLAAADVFVFPSRTDTFGVGQLEALACGVPVAAYPVTGPRDVIAGNPIGVIDEDLRAACMGALGMSREACRNFALSRSWENSARQFIGHVNQAVIGDARKPRAA